jgi:phthalate 4,5-dioxygenase oxygenase subunit
VKTFQETGDAIGRMQPHLPQAKLRSYQGVVEKNVPWRTLGASAEEASILAGLEEDETDREMANAAAEYSRPARDKNKYVLVRGR